MRTRALLAAMALAAALPAAADDAFRVIVHPSNAAEGIAVRDLSQLFLEKRDDAVAAFVRAHAGAVGYVSAGADPPGVKTLKLQE